MMIEYVRISLSVWGELIPMYILLSILLLLTYNHTSSIDNKNIDVFNDIDNKCLEDDDSDNEIDNEDSQKTTELDGLYDGDVIVKKGVLYKRGKQMKSWKMREFIMKSNELCYYDSKYNWRGSVVLSSSSTIEILSPNQCHQKKYAFVLRTNGRDLYLHALTQEDRDEWILAIESALSLLNSSYSTSLNTSLFTTPIASPKHFSKKFTNLFKSNDKKGTGFFQKKVRINPSVSLDSNDIIPKSYLRSNRLEISSIELDTINESVLNSASADIVSTSTKNTSQKDINNNNSDIKSRRPSLVNMIDCLIHPEPTNNQPKDNTSPNIEVRARRPSITSMLGLDSLSSSNLLGKEQTRLNSQQTSLSISRKNSRASDSENSKENITESNRKNSVGSAEFVYSVDENEPLNVVDMLSRDDSDVNTTAQTTVQTNLTVETDSSYIKSEYSPEKTSKNTIDSLNNSMDDDHMIVSMNSSSSNNIIVNRKLSDDSNILLDTVAVANKSTDNIIINDSNSYNNTSSNNINNNVKWEIFLVNDEKIIITSLVIKKNPYKISRKRQLVLTNSPRLFYIHPDRMIVKGEVKWMPDMTERLEVINKSTFKIKLDQKIYQFTDDKNGAQFWVDNITIAGKKFLDI